jgi:hypothetical protein
MSTSQSPAATREAMHLTFDVLRHRLLRFRGLLIAVGLLILLSLGAAIACRSWRPLLGLSLLVTLCGAFCCLDVTRVGRWQDQILGLWDQDRLDLDVFAETVSTLPGVPQDLLRGMFETLPTRKRGFARVARAAREAVARTMQALNRCQRDRTALVTLAYTLAGASLACAAFTGSWLPMVGCLTVLPLAGLIHASTALRLRRWHQTILRLVPHEPDRRELAEIVRRLEWGPIPSRQKEKWLESLVQGPVSIRQTVPGGSH